MSHKIHEGYLNSDTYILITVYENAYLTLIHHLHLLKDLFSQSAGAVEFSDYNSAEEYDPPPNECPAYDTKQSDREIPVMLELWGMWSTPSLPLFPGPVWSKW